MSAPFFSVGDTMIAYVVVRVGVPPRITIEKVPCTIMQKCGGAMITVGPSGTHFLVVGGTVQAIIGEDETFGKGQFSRIHADPDDMRMWHPYRPMSQNNPDMLPWLNENTHGLWCFYTRETVDETVEPKPIPIPSVKRETFIGFEEVNDAILFKLRWIG